MRNGETVARFEKAFAEYVGAEYGIAMCNGTATLHTALVALDVRPPNCAPWRSFWVEGDDVAGDPVAVPALTMASTTIAVLHAGGVPVFVDVNPHTWLMDLGADFEHEQRVNLPVSLYGLHYQRCGSADIDDAAQTLRPHSAAAFTSYSFQSSKHLSTGEGGMLVTDSEELATRAREFSSLGYRMDAKSPRIDPAVLKHPTYARHHSLGYNYRMADAVAEVGLRAMSMRTEMRLIDPKGSYTDHPDIRFVDWCLRNRRESAAMYRETIEGCTWITPQHIPEGSSHDMWCFTVALESKELFGPFVEAIVKHGGERPFGAWRLTYQEPAFRHLAEDGTCPVAEDLQPRLVQFQTNRLDSARTNADAVAAAIREIGG